MRINVNTIIYIVLIIIIGISVVYLKNDVPRSSLSPDYRNIKTFVADGIRKLGPAENKRTLCGL